MWFRMVTAAVAVALGAWSSGIAFAQENDAQGNVGQEDILDFVAPAQEFDRTLQSEMPLQGVMDDPVLQESIPESFSAPAPAATLHEGWLDTLRRRVSDDPGRTIAMSLAGLLAFCVAGWMVASAAYRRRARRANRRFPRSSGGSKVRGLEQVVASVQQGRKGRAVPPPLRDSVTGRSGRADA